MAANQKILALNPSELELQVAQNLHELEQNPELRADLRGLQLSSARQAFCKTDWIGRNWTWKKGNRHLCASANAQIIPKDSR
jgi:hypothetical protein